MQTEESLRRRFEQGVAETPSGKVPSYSTCPSCNSVALYAYQCVYEAEDGSEVIAPLYICTNDHLCRKKDLDPQDSVGDNRDWPLEFLIVGGVKKILKPPVEKPA
jgi:hypothetical protein